jgi:hypothetical protein
MRRAACILGAVLVAAIAGCGGGYNVSASAGSSGGITGAGGGASAATGTGGGGGGGAGGATASAGSTASSAATGSGGGGVDAVTLCPTDSMVDLYPDPWPPNPYGPKPPATACVAAAHDVIVLLGCPNNDDGTPSTCQIKRADIAVGMMNAGFGDKFITSGGAVHNAYVEADTLKTLLIERGVPAANIRTEPKAEHTDENIYYSTQIMLAEGWTSAVVVSEDRGHLVMTALCDSNCCVELGRLTLFEFPITGGPVLAGHYALYPWTPAVTTAECDQIKTPTKFMCINLPNRKACADNFQLMP